jgi:hypothetical protein
VCYLIGSCLVKGFFGAAFGALLSSAIGWGVVCVYLSFKFKVVGSGPTCQGLNI